MKKKLEYIDDLIHEQYYDEDGNINSEYYILDKEDILIFHRLDGPAVLYYNKDGSIGSVKYYINGENHREDGPAIIHYNKDGSVNKEIYYINGIQYDELQYWVITNSI